MQNEESPSSRTRWTPLFEVLDRIRRLSTSENTGGSNVLSIHRCRFAGLFVPLSVVLLVSSPVVAQPPMDGLVFWLDADDLDGDGNSDGTAPGTLVTSWTDKFGGTTLTAPGGMEPEMSDINGSPAVLFDNDFLAGDFPAAIGTPSGTAVIAFTQSDPGANTMMEFGAADRTVGDGGGAFITNHAGGLGELGLVYAENVNYNGVQGVRTDDGLGHFGVVTGNGLDPWEFFLDGVGHPTDPTFTGLGTTWLDSALTGTPAMSMGQFAGFTQTPDPCCPDSAHFGHIAEVLFYDDVLSEEDRDDLHDYLADKYLGGAPPAQRPTGLTAVADAGGGEIVLDWDDNVDVVDGYNVYRSETSGGPYDQLNVALVPTSDFVDEDIVEGVRYYYTVTAENADGESNRSTEASAILLAGCSGGVLAGAPDVPGLRFWLDSADLDADGAADGNALGTAVSSWTDKVCGLEYVQADEFSQPTLDTLGGDGAPAVLFDNDFILALDIGPDWFADIEGSIVVVFSSTNTAEGQMFTAAGGGSGAAVATNPGLNAGFVFASTSTYGYAEGATNDGAPHYGVVTTDSFAWQHYVDGFPLDGNYLGPENFNTGAWWGTIPAPTFSGLGQFFDSTTAVPDACCPHQGHVAEVLIFDHPLDAAELDEIDAYFVDKYIGDNPLPRRPTGLVASAEEGEIILDWDDNPDAVDGYNVYRSEVSGGPYDQLNIGVVPTSDFVDEDVVEGVRYYYVVTADNANGESINSAEASALVFAGCVDGNTNGAPNVAGLRLWLDAGDVDGDGNADNAAGGTAVDAWTDKVCGLVFEQADTAQQPEIDSFGPTGAPSVFFDGQDFIEDIDVGGSAAFLADSNGSAVAVYATIGPGQKYLFTASNSTLPQMLVLGADDATRGSWFIQAIGGAFGNSFFYDDTFTSNDGAIHLAEVSADGGLWSFYHNGVGPNPPATLAGENLGHWFAEIPDVDSVSLGQYTGNAPDTDGGFHGYLSELLIYDHALTEEDREEILDYFSAKYVGANPPPAAPSGLSAIAGDGEIALDWDDNLDAIDGYNVYRSETSGGPYDQLNVALVPSSDFVDEDVVEDVRYYYVVTAENANGESPNSSEASANILSGCDDPLTAGAPVPDGLAFWLDASDLDADGTLDDEQPGSIVESWTDKICGTTLVAEPGLEPLLDTLGTAPGVLFNNSFLAGPFSPNIATPSGTAVVVFSRDEFDGSPGTMMELGSNPGDGGAFITNHTDFGNLGFVFGTICCYVGAETPTNDGLPHWGVVHTGDIGWEYQVDGLPYDATAPFTPNANTWFDQANLEEVAVTTMGQFANFTSTPMGSPHIGHVAEVMIFNRVLDEDELGDIDAYVTAKYIDCTATEPGQELTCDDGEDNDCDGAVDLADPDCDDAPGMQFIRGDCDGDGTVIGQVTDAVFTLQFNFAGGRAPECFAACDSNGDGGFIGQVTDAVYTLQFNFLGGVAPVDPFPNCGGLQGMTDELLGCSTASVGCP